MAGTPLAWEHGSERAEEGHTVVFLPFAEGEVFLWSAAEVADPMLVDEDCAKRAVFIASLMVTIRRTRDLPVYPPPHG